MKFFKNPVVAILLALILVIASTLISVRIKLTNESQSIADGFYDGVSYDGYAHKSIYSQLQALTGASDGLVTIANNYGLDTDGVVRASQNLKDAGTATPPALYKLYTALLTETNSLILKLEGVSLSERDASGLATYSSTVNGVQSVIGSAGYNESVRAFLREVNRFPADVMSDMVNISMPELFA